MSETNQRRNTPQRQAILAYLRGTLEHPTAETVFRRVRRKFPRLSLGTVYRNLDLLSQEGRIRKLDRGPERARYDGNLHPHHHVRCVECGSLRDVDGLNAPSLTRKAEEQSGFRIDALQFEFSGLCPHCQPQATPRGDTPCPS